MTDPRAADPWRLGVELLAQLAQQPGFEWLREGQAMTTLLGTPALIGGHLRPELFEPAAGAWREARRAALLYD